MNIIYRFCHAEKPRVGESESTKMDANIQHLCLSLSGDNNLNV